MSREKKDNRVVREFDEEWHLFFLGRFYAVENALPRERAGSCLRVGLGRDKGCPWRVCFPRGHIWTPMSCISLSPPGCGLSGGANFCNPRVGAEIKAA